MNIAVILAGGSGSRVGGNIPKQFLTIAGKTILEHSIEAFHQHGEIDEIAIVSREDWIEEVKQLTRPYPKVSRVLCGGKERYHSSLSALRAYTSDEDHLLIHDAVRPLVTQRIIGDCIKALNEGYEAVDVAIPATDTIIQVGNDGCIAQIPPRSTLFNVQTPQAFRRGTLAEAFRMALEDESFMPTDDCSVVHRYLPRVPIYIVKGEPTNIKVTYPEDIQLAERMLT